MKKLSILLLVLLLLSPLYAGDLKKITLEQATDFMKDPFSNRLPMIPGWVDGQHYFLFEKGKLLKVNAKSGKSSPVAVSKKDSKMDLSMLLMPYNPAPRTQDSKKFLVVKADTISLFDAVANTIVPLVKTADIEGVKNKNAAPQNPVFSPDGSKFAYTIEGNLYVFDIPSGKNTRLTDDGNENILNGYASWVYMEEILGRRGHYQAFWWSPNSMEIVFMRFDQTKVPNFPLFRATGDYGHLVETRYPKPGYPNPEVKIGIAKLTDNNVQWIDFKDEDQHYLAFPTWNVKGNKIYFQWMNRGQDNLKIYCCDANSGAVKEIYHEQQKAWVDFIDPGDFHLLKNDDLLIRTPRDGWFHLYLITSTGTISQITKGEWSVTKIARVLEKKKGIYFNATKEDSTETHLYYTDFMGKSLKKLTVEKGTHHTDVSPDGRYFLDRYSNIHTPSRLVLKNTKGKMIRPLGDSATETIKEYEVSKVKVDLFRVKTKDGFDLPVIWYLPPDLDKTKKYPVLISIYGGPMAPSVSNSYGARVSTLFQAQEGIITIVADHRGSGHFGKKGMDYMHRQLGKWEMNDYIEIIDYLKTLPFIDGKRIGISGYSYGGYMAAYALTYASEHFQFGFAGSAVIDWKLYDSVYTERYMDTPQENPEGYKVSSVLTHVDKYKGGLRLTHGTMDDNVHPQNTIQLIEAVLAAKKSVELMLYPGSSHGIRGEQRYEFFKSSLDFWWRCFFNKKIDN